MVVISGLNWGTALEDVTDWISRHISVAMTGAQFPEIANQGYSVRSVVVQFDHELEDWQLQLLNQDNMLDGAKVTAAFGTGGSYGYDAYPGMVFDPFVQMWFDPSIGMYWDPYYEEWQDLQSHMTYDLDFDMYWDPDYSKYYDPPMGMYYDAKDGMYYDPWALEGY